jgi:hypothetical protein
VKYEDENVLLESETYYYQYVIYCGISVIKRHKVKHSELLWVLGVVNHPIFRIVFRISDY